MRNLEKVGVISVYKDDKYILVSRAEFESILIQIIMITKVCPYMSHNKLVKKNLKYNLYKRKIRKYMVIGNQLGSCPE